MNTASFFRSICTVIACLLLPLPLVAEQLSSRLQDRTAHTPEMGDVHYLVWTCGTNIFQFIPPHQWHTVIAGEGRNLRLEAPQVTATIIIRYSANDSPSETNTIINAEFVRELVEKRFPKGRVVEESPCYSGISPGYRCDVVWLASQNTLRVRTRLGIIQLPGGRLEFALTANDDRFSQYNNTFHNLLMSFQSSKK